MLPGEEGSEEKEKNAGEERQKPLSFIYVYIYKIPAGLHPDVVTYEELCWVDHRTSST